ncbi:NfeD family protein [Mycoavidus sp. SF9855]|uniref:NfeD family protein n=1 Tax=Mycoavidus sp. SF9855 TaxID=2968475 RepID=UPI00211CC009|nr:NfeD family protein [Mycoavidus sp. SF9855]UUM22097.1 NfeD family protein [Mycoavidus sp. SF9855]
MIETGLFWWVLAGGLVIAELLSGTFYLLMIALGCVAGGVVTLFGLSVSLQLVVAAAIALSALILLRRSRVDLAKGRHANPNNNLDLGALLQIDAWQGRRARALYRGAQWDVELLAGEDIDGQWYEIKEMRGNILVVAAKRS